MIEEQDDTATGRTASGDGDSVLVVAVWAGDLARFGELVARHEARVRAIVGLVLQDEERRSEATQHAFFLAFRHLSALKEAARFEAWLARIAGHVARDAARRLAREREREASAVEAAVSEPVSPDDARWIWDEVARLSPLLRQALELRYRGGLSYAEIAARLGVPLSTVRGRIHEARTALRGRLGESP